MTKCKGPHHDFDDFTTLRLYDFTTCDLEAHGLEIWKEGLRSGGGAFGGAPF